MGNSALVKIIIIIATLPMNINKNANFANKMKFGTTAAEIAKMKKNKLVVHKTIRMINDTKTVRENVELRFSETRQIWSNR